MRRLAHFVSALALLACERKGPQPSRQPPSRPRPPSEQAPSTAPVAPTAALEAKPSRALHHGLEWYVDAADAALREAKQSDKLLLIDLWAPWCHTCLSMREYVLTASNLADVRDRLVFVALDTERAQNAEAVRRWSVSAWPTLYLVDGDGEVQGRWVGAASPAQLSRFVRDALRAHAASRAGSLAPGDPLALSIAGDRFSAAGQWSEASESYRQALRAASNDWERKPETWVALASAQRKLAQADKCVELGNDVLATSESQLGLTASATDFLYLVLGCADGMPAQDPRRDRLARAAERKLRTLCEQGGPALTPDDRGDACGLLMELRRELSDLAGAERAARQRLQVLEAASKGVPDAIAQTYDWARAETLLSLGRGPEALALLADRESALPTDFSPPYYLARVYEQLGRVDEALQALERALARAYGPRRIGMLGLRADLQLARADRPAALETLEQQLAAYRGLPEGQRQQARELAVERRLLALTNRQ